MPRDDDGLRSLWQAQPTTGKLGLSPEQLKLRGSRLNGIVRVRNTGEYLAAALVIAVFARLGVAMYREPMLPPGLSQAGAVLIAVAIVLIVLGALYVVVKLRRDGSALPDPAPGASTAEHLAHVRASLVRQGELLRNVPRWYLAPFAPGVVLFFVGVYVLRQDLSPAVKLVGMLRPAGVCLGIFALVAYANRKASRRLERELEALDG